MSNRRPNPWRYMFATFAMLIFVGAFILSSPLVTYKVIGRVSFIDALFTSTSAVCVTGLSTIDVGQLNYFGQIILLLLMELGGLGIMTLSVSIMLVFSGQIDFGQRNMMAKLTDSFSIRDVDQILLSILIFTFISELIGFIGLFIGFYMDGFSPLRSAYLGMFHSISAFCNAGFSVFPENIVKSNGIIKVFIMLLITAGGLGFYVVYDIIHHFKDKKRLKINSKIVIVTSVSLSTIGAMLIYFFESGTISIVDSFFQSITCRTAGFNSVDLTKLHVSSIFIMIFLMFIGASPGSTGGGVKTTTAFLGFMSIVKVLKGEHSITVFKRNIPYDNILRAFAIINVYFLAISVGTILLLSVYKFDFMSAVFEITSAIGTVGLTLGVTAAVGTYGKLVLIAFMFIGRLGPSALILMLMSREKKRKIKYPDENLILG